MIHHVRRLNTGNEFGIHKCGKRDNNKEWKREKSEIFCSFILFFVFLKLFAQLHSTHNKSDCCLLMLFMHYVYTKKKKQIIDLNSSNKLFTTHYGSKMKEKKNV